ncbi:MAG: bifunctional 5,10-methylenetetrahydrofolate dehydrogenase/5,10-methenyltetrahydrofolate cyclohydrolase, partial [Limisphaerales bacterium]
MQTNNTAPRNNIIDGRAIAEQIHSETSKKVEALKSRGITPGLVFIRVGEDPASVVYVGMKEKMSARLGIRSQTYVLPEQTTQEELLDLIEKLNNDPEVHGILVQAPLPDHISQETIYSSVKPEKDVDGFHPLNVGKLLLGDPTGFRPCTPAGIQELLIRSGVQTEGADVVMMLMPDENIAEV